jgi:hypothetical protein
MTTSDSTTRATDDIRLVDGPDDALAARLDKELAEFNFDATGIRDAHEFAAALHDEGGALVAGVQGWTWGATGEVVREADDFFGHAVNYAARVTGAARGAEALVSSLVHELVASMREFVFDPPRRVELKGIDDPQLVYPLGGESAPV